MRLGRMETTMLGAFLLGVVSRSARRWCLQCCYLGRKSLNWLMGISAQAAARAWLFVFVPWARSKHVWRGIPAPNEILADV